MGSLPSPYHSCKYVHQILCDTFTMGSWMKFTLLIVTCKREMLDLFVSIFLLMLRGCDEEKWFSLAIAGILYGWKLEKDKGRWQWPPADMSTVVRKQWLFRLWLRLDFNLWPIPTLAISALCTILDCKDKVASVLSEGVECLVFHSVIMSLFEKKNKI